MVKPGESSVRCGVDRCYGYRPADGSGPRLFVRERDGSRERSLPSDVQIGDDPGLERFHKRILTKGVALYDRVTGTSADLGVRWGAGGVVPDGGSDRLMAYQVGKRMYVVDLAAIR